MSAKSKLNISSNNFHGNSSSSLVIKDFPSKLPYRIIEALSTPSKSRKTCEKN